MDNRAKEIVSALRNPANILHVTVPQQTMLDAVDLIEAQAAEIERLKAERDAAVESWRGFCAKCAWNGQQRLPDGQMDARCKTCREGGKSNWEWRGPQQGAAQGGGGDD